MNRITVIAAACVLLLIALLTLGYCQTRKEAATARSEGRVATGQANAGKGAVAATDGQIQAETENRDIEARNREDILNAENAKEDAGDAGDRGLRALCERVRYKSDSRCDQLRRADRANASQ